MKSGIYCILNTVSGKVYVGSTACFWRRKAQHWSKLKGGKHHCPHLQNAWNRDGSDAFDFVVLEQCEAHEFPSREDWWVAYLQSNESATGYNTARVAANTMLGLRHSEATRAKMSAAHKALPVPPYLIQKGDKLSPERRAKMSEISKKLPLAEGMIRKGDAHTLETRAKMSLAGKGKKLSEAECQRRSENRKKQIAPFTGKTHTEATKQKMSEARTAYHDHRRFLAAHD